MRPEVAGERSGCCRHVRRPAHPAHARPAARRRCRGGPLAEALARGDRDAVLSGDRAGAARPDDRAARRGRALGRRRHARRAAVPRAGGSPTCRRVLVLTYRDDELGRDHPLHRLLGALGGARGARLRAAAAVAGGGRPAGGGTTATSARCTGSPAGNPFFVTEVLAAAPDGRAADGRRRRARARPHGSSRRAAALEQLAVVPPAVELPLAGQCSADVTVLAEPEQVGVLDGAHRTRVAFRHELARRAVERRAARDRADASSTRGCSRRCSPRSDADLARIVHHAVAAGDDAAVVAHAPEAARRACAAGAQNQGAKLYRAALAAPGAARSRHERGRPRPRSDAWALFHANRRHDAVAAAERAVELREAARRPRRARAGRWPLSAMQQWTNLRAATPRSPAASGEPSTCCGARATARRHAVRAGLPRRRVRQRRPRAREAWPRSTRRSAMARARSAPTGC